MTMKIHCRLRNRNILITVFILNLILSLTGCICPDTFTSRQQFSIMLLPDTQFYSDKFPDVFYEQTEWVKNNIKRLNCKFVIHEGDIVDHNDVESEWLVADKAMSKLDGVVPYCFAVGNHDIPTGLYNKFFPFSRYDSQPSYGGHYGNTNDNSYHFFSAAGLDFMILCIQYDPNEQVLNWANDIAAEHPNHRIIVAAHSYLDSDKFTAEGEKIFNSLVRKYENIFLVICGHLSVGRRTDTGDNGNTIHSLLANYQELDNGGQGWLRILTFLPDENLIKVRTYSTHLKKFFSEGDGKYSTPPINNFQISYDMSSKK